MRLIFWLTSALALTVIAPAFAQRTGNASTAQSIPVAFARILNTDAFAYKVHNGRFPSWEQLVSGEMSKPRPAINGNGLLAETWEHIDFSAEQPLQGFNVRWDLNADGSRYSFAISEGKNCGTTVVSNESGVIYLATALGCPLQ